MADTATAQQTHTILVVEDGNGEREAMARVLRLAGYDVVTAQDVESGLAFIGRPIDLVISDFRMGTRSGVDLLQQWRQHQPTTPFFILTAYGDIVSAVRAIKLGARDYLTKPVDPARLLQLINASLQGEKPLTQEISDSSTQVDKLLGSSAGMSLVREQVLRAAAADSTVLILGESGTGKELVAQAIHSHSRRGRRPLITVNMAAVPEALIESEMFGHMKGAFTGATTERIGRFEMATTGTLFIDEIGDFPQHCQAKLLRILESRVVQPIGGETDRSIDVRVIAATSRDLRKMMAGGTFRTDLFYRLNVISIEIPPLRSRPSDIPQLVRHFLRSISTVLDRPVPQLSTELFACLCNHDWPGNVRELRNCVESMVVMARQDELTLRDLPAGIRAPAPDDSSSGELSRLGSLEKSIILQTLDRCGGNRTHAANQLGISVRTLHRRLKNWGVTDQ